MNGWLRVAGRATVRGGPVLAVLLGVATPMSAFAASTDQQAIIDLHAQWAEARKKGDVAFLERFYAPELTLNVMNGAVVSRATDIAAFANRAIKPDLIENSDMVIRIYGSTAVVSNIEHVRGTAYGRPGEFRLRMTNILVRQQGRWRLVHSQSTPIQ